MMMILVQREGVMESSHFRHSSGNLSVSLWRDMCTCMALPSSGDTVRHSNT